MKKLTFFFILVIGFCFGASDLMAQHSMGPVPVFAAKQGGTLKSKDLITASILQKLPVLQSELQNLAGSGLGEKAKNVEVLLYKGMLSDLKGGMGVRAAYDKNVEIFIMDYPQGEGFGPKKAVILGEFNSTVFYN